MSYGFCWPIASGIGTLIPLASSQQNLYDIPIAVYTVITPDDGKKYCLKHVEFYSKNNFEKFVNLIGFVIRIYRNAHFSEC